MAPRKNQSSGTPQAKKPPKGGSKGGKSGTKTGKGK
jgi:hypothetical protein